ncbi:MafI family immunity protein [Cronobacter dublinensis]|uniref:MafI family immunity protein n=1 Tax=Cronobacter dublinensis TaxID=413497 RepID=UPI0024AF26BC|nr:MafI family immunity protein [Cronobacter dublinensis]ELQ5994640.1 MafI family immunity protein [Cronobacter dublinensis]MDI7491225.1 MafI family immunity protein [Cronobacter dublinensis]MDI7504142.1 MafI family immunity protein [Cronobacter dublinensis]
MSINNRIKILGEGLKDRIDASIIDFDLEYIDHSESILAFETLCDHIADYDVVITKDEYNQVINIANELNLDINNRYLYINPENKK